MSKTTPTPATTATGGGGGSGTIVIIVVVVAVIAVIVYLTSNKSSPTSTSTPTPSTPSPTVSGTPGPGSSPTGYCNTQSDGSCTPCVLQSDGVTCINCTVVNGVCSTPAPIVVTTTTPAPVTPAGGVTAAPMGHWQYIDNTNYLGMCLGAGSDNSVQIQNCENWVGTPANGEPSTSGHYSQGPTNSDGTQLWQINEIGSSGWYQVLNKKTGMCAYADSSKVTNASSNEFSGMWQIYLKTCSNNDTSQQWQPQYAPNDSVNFQVFWNTAGTSFNGNSMAMDSPWWSSATSNSVMQFSPSESIDQMGQGCPGNCSQYNKSDHYWLLQSWSGNV